MTLEQAKDLYPKFYKYPANYLGIDVEYTNPITNAKGTSILNIDLLSILLIAEELDRCVPKFKPQEGEQFIKDLEEAVNPQPCGIYYKFQSEHYGEYWFKYKDVSLFIKKEDLGTISITAQFSFDTASYVDTLRQKGYYL